MGSFSKAEIERNMRMRNSQKDLRGVEKDLDLLGNFGTNIRKIWKAEEIYLRYIFFRPSCSDEGIDAGYYPLMIDSYDDLGPKFRRNLANVCVALNPLTFDGLERDIDNLMKKALQMLDKNGVEYHQMNIESQLISSEKSVNECIYSLNEIRLRDPTRCDEDLIRKSLTVACLTDIDKFGEIYEAAGRKKNRLSVSAQVVNIRRGIIKDQLRSEVLLTECSDLPLFKTRFILKSTQGLVENWV